MNIIASHIGQGLGGLGGLGGPSGGSSGGVGDSAQVEVGCWCTSFEQNLYRPQVCLANPLRACGWKNAPKQERKQQGTTHTISNPIHSTSSANPARIENTSTPTTVAASATPIAGTISTSTTSLMPNITLVKRKISSDNPSIHQPTPIPTPIPTSTSSTPSPSPSPSPHTSPTHTHATAQPHTSYGPPSRPPPPIPTTAATSTPGKPDSNWVPRSYSKTQSGGNAPKAVAFTSTPNMSTPTPNVTHGIPTISTATTTTPTKTSTMQGPPISPRSSNSSEGGNDANPSIPSPTSAPAASPPTSSASPPVPPRSYNNARPPNTSPGSLATAPTNTTSVINASAATATAGIANSNIRAQNSPKLTRDHRNAIVLPARPLVPDFTSKYSALSNFEPAEACTRMLRSLIWLNGISVDEKFVKEFFVKLESEASKNKTLTSAIINKRQLRDQALLGLSIKSDIEHLMHVQSQLHKIVIIQSLVRRFLVKKKVTNLKKYQLSPHKERNAIFRDLLKGERGYISNLSLIVMAYMNPLKASLRNSVFLSSFTLTVTPDDLHSIFSNVDVLLKVHTTVLGEFEMLLDKWPAIEEIGAVFLKKASELKVYGEYVKNFQNALHTLNRLQEENAKFAQFLSERMQRNYGDPGLMSLISCPLNQISQYAILLERILHATPESHVDYEKLTAAAALMKEIYKMLQESIEQTNNRAKMMDLQRRILPHTTDFELMLGSRFVVAEGGVNVYLKKKKRPYNFTVFNDVFLLCRVKKTMLKVKYHFPYSQLVVEEELHATLLPPGTDTALTPVCGIVVPRDKIILVFGSKQEHKNFLQKIKPLCEKANPSRRVFGTGLIALMKREKSGNASIPTPLVAMVEAIKKNIQVEGIFRVSGAMQALQSLRDVIENSEKLEDIDLREYDVHTVASALKAFFREMPEPLMTFHAYDDLASIADDSQVDSRLQSLRLVIANMPKLNREVLQYLIVFLAQVAAFSSKNKMNYTNLSIVMGPNLVRPMQNTLETTLLMPKLNSIIADLIEHSAEVFEKMDI